MEKHFKASAGIGIGAHRASLIPKDICTRIFYKARIDCDAERVDAQLSVDDAVIYLG